MVGKIHCNKKLLTSLQVPVHMIQWFTKKLQRHSQSAFSWRYCQNENPNFKVCSKESSFWMESSLVWNCSRLPSPQWCCILHIPLPSFKSLSSCPPSNLRARKAKEDFTLTLLKRWRGLVLTGDNTSKFSERILLWKELIALFESQPKQIFSAEEINKRRVRKNSLNCSKMLLSFFFSKWVFVTRERSGKRLIRTRQEWIERRPLVKGVSGAISGNALRASFRSQDILV